MKTIDKSIWHPGEMFAMLGNTRQLPRVHCHPEFKNEMYETDQHGLRVHNCQGDKTLLTVGCSFTFGQALYKEDTWADILAKKLGYNLVNVGTPGASVGMCCTNAIWALENFDIDLIVWYAPAASRLEFYRNDDTIGIIYQHDPQLNKWETNIPKETFKWRDLYLGAMNDTQYIHNLQLLQGVFSMTKHMSIPSVFNWWGWDDKGLKEVEWLCDRYDIWYQRKGNRRIIPNLDWAYDKAHYGRLSNLEFAKRNYSLIQEKLGVVK